MADNKSKRHAADRRQVAAGEGYEVSYFAKKHGITKEEAEKLIARIGRDRAKLNAAAEKLKPAAGAKVVKAATDAVKSAVKAGKAALPKVATAKKR